MQAVILAAGTGSRIRDIHTKPKGFIRLGEQPIICESIHKLKSVGIQNILIVTGYAAEYYTALAENDPTLSVLFNEHYHCYGNLFSLYCARNWIADDFVLLESDIIYESRSLSAILHSTDANTILLSGQTNSTDEVYVEAKDKKLMRMSKQKHTLNERDIYGEFVGINKIALKDFQALIPRLESNPQLLQKGCYDEHGFVEMTKYTDIFCLKLPDLIWSEIDNEVQLARAMKLYDLIAI